ncbi:hypothetical protein MG293_001429 [Ovis ammon polii]|uniref:Olduvai domain-containing protein n=1 Tax=Ovis ammon polii TaxID=230172 RepID=A0AAD4YI18_OVIAM|nr:hypothetical protein MG293_001429 [Ovis ammon polii]
MGDPSPGRTTFVITVSALPEPQLGPHTGNTERIEGMKERKSTGLEDEKSQRKARSPIPSPLRITLAVVTNGNTLRLDCSCGFHLSKCGIRLYEAPDFDKEPTLMEINQELRLQLAKCKQDFRNLTEKFLISQATAYSLANQLQKYKCEACKDIVESVLGEKLLFEVRRPAEKPAEKQTLDEMLRTCDTLIQSQARELTQLRQTLQHGKDDSVLLKQHLKDLLTHNDQGSHQGQGFRERLSEGYRLAERIACKLSPEIYEDEDDEQAQEKLTPSMELQEVEKREVPEESKDECGLLPSILQRSSDSLQPYSNDKFKFNDLEADLGQDGACGCSHAKEEEITTNVSDNENYHKPMSGQELPFPSVNLQDDEKKVVFQQSQDECVSVPSTLQEGSACNQPYSDGEFAFDEEKVASAMDGACGCSHAEEDEISTGLPENQNDHDDMKGPEVLAPRFSRQLPQMRGNGVPRDSLDEYYLTSSVLPGLSDSFWPYGSNAIFSLEDVDVSYARDVTKNLADLEDKEDQDIISSSVEQLVVEENEVQPDSLDECYLAASVGHHLAGSCHPYRSASFPTERREVCLALDVNGDNWENCYRGPVSFPGSEVPASQAQLQKSTHVTDFLQWQLDQRFDCGDSKAMLGLSSTIWDLTSTSDSGNHGPLCLVVVDGRDIDFFAEDRSIVYSKVYILQLSDHFLMIKFSQDLTVVPSLCVSYKSLNWAHTLETQKAERGWKKGNQQVWKMRNPKEKQDRTGEASVTPLLQQNRKMPVAYIGGDWYSTTSIPSPLRITLDVVTDGNTLHLDCSCGFHLSKCGIHLYEAPDLDKGQNLPLWKINQELQLQLAKCKQDFRDLTEKFLISQATAYSLANQLQKYIVVDGRDIDFFAEERSAVYSKVYILQLSDHFLMIKFRLAEDIRQPEKQTIVFKNSQDLTVVPSLCVSYKSLNWAHTLETQKAEGGWKKGYQQVWKMRNPKEKQDQTGEASVTPLLQQNRKMPVAYIGGDWYSTTSIPSPLRITLDAVTDGNTLHLDCSCGFHLPKCGIHLYEAPDLDKGQNVRPHSNQKIDFLKAFAESHTPTIIKLCTRRTVWGYVEEKLS